jgi:hypothetical protein
MIINRTKKSRMFVPIALATVSAHSAQADPIFVGAVLAGSFDGSRFSVSGVGFSMSGTAHTTLATEHAISRVAPRRGTSNSSMDSAPKPP